MPILARFQHTRALHTQLSFQLCRTTFTCYSSEKTHITKDESIHTRRRLCGSFEHLLCKIAGECWTIALIAHLRQIVHSVVLVQRLRVRLQLFALLLLLVGACHCCCITASLQSFRRQQLEYNNSIMRNQLLKSALELVPTHGWQMRTLHEAARVNGMPSISHKMLGGSDGIG